MPGPDEFEMPLIRSLRRFRRDHRGNVALTFALLAVPLTFMVGMGLDIANATRIKLALQDATDSSAIGLARQASAIADSAIASTAKSYIQASYNDTTDITITSATIDRDTITATVDARADVPVFFSQLLGKTSIPVSAHAVAKGMLLEIALVLDTSGSMAQSAGSGGSKISALRTAGDSFLDAMFGAQTTSQRVKVSVVPFAASVNVGSGNSGAAWMDTGSASSLAYEDFNGTTKSRWQLFADLNNTSWKGCVISRPSVSNLDVNDTAPTSGDTLFVPWFAPDEPDGDNGAYDTGSFSNNYLNDEGGNCTGTDKTVLVADSVKQSRVCKYRNVTPSGGSPNYLCDSNPITPLTDTRTTLDPAISSLQANGNTNILEGLMWGWRSISPGAPFTEGKAYTAPNNRKVIVMMTDGENNLNGVSNFDHSSYSSYGYAIKGRVGTTSSNNTTLTTALNTRTELACDNAKAQGILIYSIALGASASGSAALLQNCASDPTYYYAPQNSSDLVPVFKKIAQSINSLRIAQ